MTVTHPIINDSRRVLWVVTVSEKTLGLALEMHRFRLAGFAEKARWCLRATRPAQQL